MDQPPAKRKLGHPPKAVAAAGAATVTHHANMSKENSATAVPAAPNQCLHPSLAGIASAAPELPVGAAAQKKRGRPPKTTLPGAGQDTMVATTHQSMCKVEAAAPRRNPGRLYKLSMTAAPTTSLTTSP
ncbi:hypothetical protein FN846DRAFT_892474 [Sphaerosporella brunnea]|uniref:Uncharacterized protein n=1 Tax=Sphaerosporella brunnea TaxID=1250544 RepID=A0A5J5EP29_9PEZI|nr:hypothetical protein FN846DRAFT_892474 [Sphaerosporella brunnea]